MTTTESTPVAAATKVVTLCDARVEAEFNLTYSDSLIYDQLRGGFVQRTVEQRAQLLEKMCKEYEEFVRDHRSQDRITLRVVREWREECSACHETWEPLTDETGTHCFNCGVEVQS